MGGAIGALVLEKYPHLFDCAILTSPMLKMRYNGMPELLVKRHLPEIEKMILDAAPVVQDMNTSLKNVKEMTGII